MKHVLLLFFMNVFVMMAQENPVFHERLYSSWRKVDWPELLSEAESSLVIAVYYWDGWVKQNFTQLTRLLHKPGFSITFVFSDPQCERVRTQLKEVFPEYSAEEISQKIAATTRPLIEYCNEHNLGEKKVTVFLTPHTLSYPFQIIDDKLLIMSFFALHRDKNSDAPAFAINLNAYTDIKNFITNECKKLTLK